MVALGGTSDRVDGPAPQDQQKTGRTGSPALNDAHRHLIDGLAEMAADDFLRGALAHRNGLHGLNEGAAIVGCRVLFSTLLWRACMELAKPSSGNVSYRWIVDEFPGNLCGTRWVLPCHADPRVQNFIPWERRNSSI